MASPTVTYTFTNSTVADADEVNTNFTDIINALTDASKDISISALTAAGTATLNGSVAIGNASSDDLTVTASLASSIPIKTTNTYDIGSATLGLAGIYLGNAGGSTTVRVVSASSIASSFTATIPDAGASCNFVMSAGSQTISGTKTFSASTIVITASGGGEVKIQDSGTDRWGIGSNDANGTDSWYLYSYDNSAYNAFCTQAGSFTFGPSGTNTNLHTIRSGQTTVGSQILTVKKYNVAQNTNGNYYMAFGTSGSDDGYINTNGSAVLTLTDASDERWKENIQDADYGLATIEALRPVTFDWKTGSAKKVKGFIAQEVKKVLPECVTFKDESESGGLPDAHYLEMQTMIPVLVRAVQELSAKVKELTDAKG